MCCMYYVCDILNATYEITCNFYGKASKQQAKHGDDCELFDMHLTLLQNVNFVDGPSRKAKLRISNKLNPWTYSVFSKTTLKEVLSWRLAIPLCYFTAVFFEQPISSTEYLKIILLSARLGDVVSCPEPWTEFYLQENWPFFQNWPDRTPSCGCCACVYTALRKIFLRSFDWGWGAWHHLTAFILLFGLATKSIRTKVSKFQIGHFEV